ncbi:AimR family lysis-lysogeny pheromone receptor [Oceanobacillus salinisoli]|uniref:AimR family lysis-lysogeny pheromone receptor n=1 Tax=Oceanobacillus salinisoli TaxID=2678611 RepID=UPI001E5D33FF|nr:AimR family lysis-lysogeny pheromone receptor [Oceanobacillus salinisoli]
MRLSASIVSNTIDLTLEQLQEALKLEYDEENVIQLMRKYCLESSSRDIQKKGMEFLYMNGFYDDLEILININEESPDPSNRQWAEVYKILYQLRRKEYQPISILDKINHLKTTEPELLCLLEFSKVNVHFNMNYYQELGNFLHRYDKLLPNIDDYYLVESFKIRYNQVAFIYTLMRNELIMARKHGYKLLNLTKNSAVHVDTHIKLGLSYTFDSYFQGMYHMKEALKIAKKNNITEAIDLIEQQNIPFLSAHFNKPEHITTTDKSEQAHLEIAKGNHEYAITILNEVPIDTPFRKYYLGKAKQDKTLLLQAYKDFVHKRSDYFFCRLPLNELRKLYI